ncbi:MAG: gas vesicle protein [Nocardioidaceae bacterium]|nr:gas vesicle protein [Nocardioidaceae bacterium]
MATEKSTAETPAKKTPAKKTAKKSAKKTATKKASAPRAAAPKRVSGGQVAGLAAQQLLELTGKEAEGVTGLERTDDGWRVQVEVVEVRRIPDTTDILALYEIEVDGDGDLQSYRRLRRYARGVPGEE